jgi:alpha-beta hydrolase superfamily lysophospholipase
MKDFDIPFIYVQGGKDKKINPTGAFEFIESAKSLDKTLLFYPDLWHDILYEPELWGILRRVIDWCN